MVFPETRERRMPEPSLVLDVRAFIDQRPFSSTQWLILVLCFLLVMADGMDVAIMGFLAPVIGRDWHVSRELFGVVMGAAPLGLAFGALMAGPPADRYGRKSVLMASVVLFGVFSLASGLSVGIKSLALFRFLTGLGLGATMPCATTLLSEYVPTRARALLITCMFTGFNLGSALIGFAAAAILPLYGWRAVLMFGGLIPLVLLPFYLKWLPESARFMVVRGKEAARIARTLTRVCGIEVSAVSHFVVHEGEVSAKQPVVALIGPAFRQRTIALWLTYFMGLVTIYLFSSWMPTLITMEGLSIERAATTTALFQLGGTLGAVLVGFLMDRHVPHRVISAAYVGGALSIGLLASSHASSPAFGPIAALAGFCVSGAQTGLNAYAPSCYPTAIRATGVSWMLGIGRFGSIFGSLIGGVLLSFGWGAPVILCMVGLPSLVAAFGVLGSRSNAASPTY